MNNYLLLTLLGLFGGFILNLIGFVGLTILVPCLLLLGMSTDDDYLFEIGLLVSIPVLLIASYYYYPKKLPIDFKNNIIILIISYIIGLHIGILIKPNITTNNRYIIASIIELLLGIFFIYKAIIKL
jgi:uncharacterized membrane protein YfcA